MNTAGNRRPTNTAHRNQPPISRRCFQSEHHGQDPKSQLKLSAKEHGGEDVRTWTRVESVEDFTPDGERPSEGFRVTNSRTLGILSVSSALEEKTLGSTNTNGRKMHRTRKAQKDNNHFHEM